VSAQLEADDVVRVVAPALANGAPHPMFGRVGVVLEVRDIGRYPVRVSVDGRPVMFAAAELARNDDTPTDLSRDEMSRSSG
jgi:ribosomal protein L21E